MKIIGAYLLLLLIGASLSVKDEENSILNRAYEMQKVMGDYMKMLIDNGEITKTTITWDVTGKVHNLYELTGEHAQKLPLKNVFDMLQSWNWYIQNQARPFEPDNPPKTPFPDGAGWEKFPDYTDFFDVHLFRFNFAGEVKTIGLQVSRFQEPHGANAIKVLDDTNKGLEYVEIFQTFESSDLPPAKIAEYMLEALNKPMNDQPVWPDSVSADLRTKMLNLAVIIETAEGARPSDEFYRVMKEASIRVHDELETRGFFEQWMGDFAKQLSKNSYDVRGLEDDYERYRDFMDLFIGRDQANKRAANNRRKIRDEQDPTRLQRYQTELAKDEQYLKENLRDLSDILPKHTPEFYNELSNAKTMGDDELRTFLTENGYELTGYMDLEKLKAAIDNYDINNEQTKLEIEDSLPYIAVKKVTDLFGSIKKRVETFKTQLNALISKKALGPEFRPDGRVPGAGYLARALLKRIAEGNLRSWREFDRIFRVSAKEGLRPARENRILFDVSVRPEDKFAQAAFDEDRIRFMEDHRQPFLEQLAALDATQEQLPDVEGACGGAPARRRKRAACSRKPPKEKIIDDSVQWEGDRVRFKTVDDQGVIKNHDFTVPVDEMAISKYFKERTATAREVTKKIGIGLGVYGTLVNGLTAVEQFMNGNYGQGAFSTAQTLHSIGGLTGFNTKFQRMIVRKAWNTAAEKYGFEKITEELSEPIAREAGKAGKTLARFLEDVPFIGLAFDIYFIIQDFEALANDSDKTPKFLKVAHLILDVTISVLTLVETFAPELDPFIEPIVIALTIIRISIDDFYYDIKRELDKVKGADFGTQLLAFIKGFEEGIGDVLTLGLITQLNDMDDALEYQRKLWHNMTDPGKYFNQTLAGHGDIDFNGGIMSGFGGFLSVTLNEDGSFTMELPEVYIGQTPRSIKKTFKYKTPANEIVLGIGEVKSPQYIHKEVKLWLFIPVTSYDIVNKFLGHDSSLYGRYYGNSFNNTFYTIQRNLTGEDYNEVIGRECDTDKLNPSYFNELLSKYEYDLFGHGGNDKFFLGPQAATILGGDGKDLYYIPVTGGRTIINNFALDEELDTLFMNMTYSDITCRRYEHDLIVTFCDTHVVKAKHWFIRGENSNYFRHINIVTNDEVVLDVVDTDISSDGGEYQVTCYPVLMDRSRSKGPVTVDMSVGALSHVVRFIGSNFSDLVTGNDKNNQIRGGLGDDSMEGGEGEDAYLHTEGDGNDLINNYSNDLKNDTVIIGIDFNQIGVSADQDSLRLYNGIDSITMLNWYRGPKYQHALFMSKDYISFFVLGEKDDPMKYPVNIDFTQSHVPIFLNLTSSESVAHDFYRGVLTRETASDIQVIIDSPHNDVIIGNNRNNIITCSGQKDIFQGSSGSDTYVVRNSCKSLTIINKDPFESVDLLLLNCSSSDVSLSVDGSNLDINYQQGQEQHVVKLFEWFKSSINQHLMVKTQDKWTFLPPEDLKSFKSYIEPFQIEISDSCDGGVETYDFNQSPYHELQRFLAKASNCRFVIKGNHQNNYIDPGPSDSYGYQVLTGGNGSDTYVFGHNYGVDNAIHNYATDGEYDHLLLNIIYRDIHVEQINNDIVLSSISVNNSVEVSLHNYTIGKEYQHIFIHASDGIIFQVKIRDFNVSKEISLIDHSNSPFSQIISATNEDPSYAHVRGIFGSQVEENEIHGGNETMKIVGGNNDDKIYGGNFKLGEDINGLDGNDYINGGGGDDNIAGGNGNDTIFGGDGDDDIYAGKGADYINGGNGTDTIIFSGDGAAINHGEPEGDINGGINHGDLEGDIHGAQFSEEEERAEYVNDREGVDYEDGGDGSDDVWIPRGTGVLVNLIVGFGMFGDAEGDTYVSIENIAGSQFNDTLIGNGGDNTIRGNGGNDYIVPGGGFDILQGGLDADIYDVTEAYGLKVINNFASDNVLDTVLYSDVEFDDMCYYFLGNDLHVITSYNSSNSSGAMERALFDQEYLEVKLLYWSGNETYRHIALMFADAFIYPENNFTTNGRDFSDTSIELQDQTMAFLSVTSTTETSITLNLRLNSSLSSSNPLPNDAQLYYIHNDGNISTIQPLHLNYDQNSAFNSFTVDGLKSGVRQSFVVMLAICQAKATISSMLTVTTLPNPPLGVNASVIPGGFEVNWISPDNKTDPYVFYYNYTIQYWLIEKPNQVFTIKYDDVLLYDAYEISGSHIHPKKVYMISVASRITKEVTSSPVNISNPITAGDSICSNFNSLPSHMYIDSIGLVNDNSRAYLACDDNYEVIGQSYLDCNVSVPVDPVCRLVRCNAVHDSVLKAIPLNSSVAHGETNQWTCYDHYELVGGGNTFTSTCDGTTGWNPPLKTCILKPACSPYPSIQDGSTQPAFAYRDEEITFSCKDNYSREGPEKKTCVASGQSVVYSPSTLVRCIRKSCPMLLPQPNGVYTLPSGNFVNRVYLSGERVNLQCNAGYYIRDDQNSPNTQTLTCTIEGHWSVQQQACQSLIYFTNINQYLALIRGNVHCRVPQWSGCNLNNLFPSLNSFACSILGGHQYSSLSGNTLECSMVFRFEHRPPLPNGNTNTYAGRLTIAYPSGSTDTACPNNPSSSTMDSVCSALGYSLQYTAKLINVGGYHTTKEFTSMSSTLTDRSQTCTKMISCRGTCDPLYVPGLASQCNKLFEGERCYLDCLPGSKQIGPRERVCQSNGQWSGGSTSCDDDRWKSDADGYVRIYSFMSHGALASTIVQRLTAEYPDVTWIAIVYDPVSGFDKHTLYSSGHYVYYKFRYYGKNFVVGRYTNARLTYSRGLGNELIAITGAAASSCKKYCGDPACWFPYYNIDAEKAAELIYNRINSRFGVRLAMVVQGNSASFFVGRKEPSGAVLAYNSIGLILSEVDWDRRIATRILFGCEKGIATTFVMAD